MHIFLVIFLQIVTFLTSIPNVTPFSSGVGWPFLYQDKSTDGAGAEQQGSNRQGNAALLG